MSTALVCRSAHQGSGGTGLQPAGCGLCVPHGVEEYLAFEAGVCRLDGPTLMFSS